MKVKMKPRSIGFTTIRQVRVVYKPGDKVLKSIKHKGIKMYAYCERHVVEGGKLVERDVLYSTEKRKPFFAGKVKLPQIIKDWDKEANKLTK